MGEGRTVQRVCLVQYRGPLQADVRTGATCCRVRAPRRLARQCRCCEVAGRNLPLSGHQKLIDPDTFKDFYTCWKETEAEAQEVSLPASVMEHLDKNECVYKLSRSVKTNRGVGKIAMTQKRLFLLTEGRPGYVEISTFRNIEVRSPALLPGVFA